jgi:HK97 family phage portal protein
LSVLFNKRNFKSRSKKQPDIQYTSFSSAFDAFIASGYTTLADNPEVKIAVDRVADLVSNMTIHLMENTDKGDKRLKNALSKKIDVSPAKFMTRKSWIYKIVSDLLLYGDGNSVVHIGIDPKTGLIDDLKPFPMAGISYVQTKKGYVIESNDVRYSPDEVIHFVINPDPNYPYKGTGYRVALRDILKNLKQATTTKNIFMSGKYMPSLIVKVDSLTAELASEEGRDGVYEKYLESSEAGKPWIIPAELLEVQQVKPLSLKDIAINESVEIDKKTVAGILNVPAFFLGVGEFDKDEYNNFISTKIMSIATVIAQTLTKDVLYDSSWYFKLNPRSLYSYSLEEIVKSYTEVVDRMAMDRNELRNELGFDPREDMEELLALENFIPQDKLGDQGKLKGGDND